MKPNTELYTSSFQLHSYLTKEDWQLSANYDEEKQQYYGVGLQTPFKKDGYWDNRTYLYTKLLPFLYDFTNNKCDEEQLEEEKKLVKKLKDDENLTDTLISMLERGRLMGWNRY